MCVKKHFAVVNDVTILAVCKCTHDLTGSATYYLLRDRQVSARCCEPGLLKIFG